MKKSKLIPIYYVFTLVGGLSIIILIFIRGLSETSSRLKILGNTKNFLYALFNQITEISLITVLHYWINYYINEKRGWPKIITMSLFISIYALIFSLILADYQFGLNGMQFVSPSSFAIWFHRISKKVDHFSFPVHFIKTIHKKDMSNELVREVMRANPTYHYIVFTLAAIFGIFILVLLVIYRNFFIQSTLLAKYFFPYMKRKYLNKVKDTQSNANLPNNEGQDNNEIEIHNVNDDIVTPKDFIDEYEKVSDELQTPKPNHNSKENEDEQLDKVKNELPAPKIEDNENTDNQKGETTNKENEQKIETPKTEHPMELPSEHDTPKEEDEQDEYITSTPTEPKNNCILIIFHLLALFHIVFFIIVYFTTFDLKSSLISQLTYLQSCIICLSHFEKHITSYTKDNFLNFTRDYLPPNRYWLDINPEPIYPAVHGDKEAFCAYNPYEAICEGYTPPKPTPLVKQMPNVLFIVYESFNPGYYLINDDFITEHASLNENDPLRYITDTLYYSPTVFNKIHKFGKYGVTFSGMSSLGIPSASGWHSLTTGVSVSQSFYNILEASLMHVDDLPSSMRNYGYRTFFLAASQVQFDCMNFFAFRRPAREEAMERLKCKEVFGDLYDDDFQRNLMGEKEFNKVKSCARKEKEIEKLTKQMKKRRLDFPKWFDYYYHYTLTPDNAALLGFDPADVEITKSNWSPDRVSTREFILHWQQQKRSMKKHNIEKPLFGSIMTMDSHFEFFGYDKSKYYEYTITNEMKKDVTEWMKHRFIRVNKYADKYVGELLEWFRDNEPNTIFLITGDHGVRKIPVNNGDDIAVDDVIYSSDCVHGSSGSDNFFVTSGMIGYLGNDSVIKEVMHLDKIQGKTLKLPTDHNDLVYTLEDILTKLNGTTIQPTHRRSRNLMDMTNDLVNHIENDTLDEGLREIDQSGWTSYSFNHYNIDYREGTNLLRTHPADKEGSHYYTKASYPHCLIKRNGQHHPLGGDEALKSFRRMEGKIASENYLNINNRIYNYAFRDLNCIKHKNCTIQPPAGELEYYDYVIIRVFLQYLIMIWICVWAIAELSVLILFYITVAKDKVIKIFKERSYNNFTNE